MPARARRIRAPLRDCLPAPTFWPAEEKVSVINRFLVRCPSSPPPPSLFLLFRSVSVSLFLKPHLYLCVTVSGRLSVCLSVSLSPPPPFSQVIKRSRPASLVRGIFSLIIASLHVWLFVAVQYLRNDSLCEIRDNTHACGHTDTHILTSRKKSRGIFFLRMIMSDNGNIPCVTICIYIYHKNFTSAKDD